MTGEGPEPRDIRCPPSGIRAAATRMTAAPSSAAHPATSHQRPAGVREGAQGDGPDEQAGSHTGLGDPLAAAVELGKR